MKKFICAILICLSLTFCFTITGCKDKDYDIKDFYTTYQNIGNNATNLTLTEFNDNDKLEKVDIDYTKFTKLSILVNNSSTQYYQLKHFYQQLLDNSLSPLYAFGSKIASSKNISDKKTEQLFKNLYELKQEYEDIDYYVGILVNSLNATDDVTINLSNLRRVFIQYEEAITKANNLSIVICDVYFDTVLNNSNFNYSSKTYDQLNENDLTYISINTKAKIHYYKSVYANIYNQLYIRNGDWAEILSSTTNIALPSYQPYTFIKNISSLNINSTENLLNNKLNIYNNVLSLYHIQNSFDEAYNNFNIATNKVAYVDLDDSSTIDELNYGSIITQFSNGIAYDSYEILNNLVSLLYY